jgi:hypothetical protein
MSGDAIVCRMTGCDNDVSPDSDSRYCPHHREFFRDVGTHAAPSTLRHDPSDAPAARATAIMRRSVIRTMATEDAGENYTARPEETELQTVDLDSYRAAALDSLGIIERSADDAEATRLYDATFRAEWKRLREGKPERVRTPHDVMKARVREHLVELIVRAWIGGAKAELAMHGLALDGRRASTRREDAIESAPSMVDGALDAIMQVLA